METEVLDTGLGFKYVGEHLVAPNEGSRIVLLLVLVANFCGLLAVHLKRVARYLGGRPFLGVFLSIDIQRRSAVHAERARRQVGLNDLVLRLHGEHNGPLKYILRRLQADLINSYLLYSEEVT